MAARFIDKNGYEREVGSNRLVHRNIAYRQIYIPNRQLFSRPFRYYQVHHRDKKKRNNAVSNLQIVTRREHERIHHQGIPLKLIATLLLFLFFTLMLLFWAVLMLAHR